MAPMYAHLEEGNPVLTCFMFDSKIILNLDGPHGLLLACAC